nr:phosphatidylinositol 3- and 4-kinase family protein with FAT domain isoform 1 [Tanacetum cinerariifolium]
MAGGADGNAIQGGGSSASDNQLHPRTQSAGLAGSHDGGSSQGQEPEWSIVAEGNVLGGNENPSSMSVAPRAWYGTLSKSSKVRNNKDIAE